MHLPRIPLKGVVLYAVLNTLTRQESAEASVASHLLGSMLIMYQTRQDSVPGLLGFPGLTNTLHETPSRAD